jgi:hypothetical protein
MAEITLTTRGRSVTDAMSGMAISRNHAVYDKFTQEDLEMQFTRFKQYDVDDTGFISKENLMAVVDAIGMTDVTLEQCANMIEEVALLTGHENDGKLSFRDYCALIAYEMLKQAETEEAQAREELLEESFREESMREESEREEDPKPETETRMRGSSFAVLNTLAMERVKRFEQVAKDVAEKETEAKAGVPKSDGVASAASKMQERLAKFRNLDAGAPAGAAQPTLGNDKIHMATMKAKLGAFETALRANQQAHAWKKSWKNMHYQAYRKGTKFDLPPPAAKSLADLP